MDANAHKMDEIKGDLRTQRGEMQSMGLNLQAGTRGIMAAPRGGATEPTRSVQCVRPAMEAGKVEGTSDVIIDGETCRTRHDEVTEELNEEKNAGIKRDKGGNSRDEKPGTKRGEGDKKPEINRDGDAEINRGERN